MSQALLFFLSSAIAPTSFSKGIESTAHRMTFGAVGAEGVEAAVRLRELGDPLLDGLRVADPRLAAIGVDRAPGLVRLLLDRGGAVETEGPEGVHPGDAVRGQGDPVGEVLEDVPHGLAPVHAEHGDGELEGDAPRSR